MTLGRMSVAVASFAFKGILLGIRFPLFLHEIVSAFVTIGPGRIMLASTLELVRGIVGGRTLIGMAIADTPTSNRNLLDAVVILTEEKKIREKLIQ